MRLKKQRVIAEINITPFTDVILVLLVIFMLTTPLIIQSSIKVNVPQAGSAKPRGIANRVNVIINSANSMYLENKLVTQKELEEKLSLLRKRNSEIEIFLFSDERVQFRDIVSVLDIINKLEITNIHIAAKA